MLGRRLAIAAIALFPAVATAQVEVNRYGTYSNYSSQQAPVAVSPAAGDQAALDARMAQLEEQMRRMQGSLEEMQYKLNMLGSNSQQYQEMTDKKVSMLEQKMATTHSAAAGAAVAPSGDTQQAAATATTSPAAGPAAAQTTVKAAASASARDQYNQAFQLLNQANFKDARTILEQFVQRYPDDGLIGNAYYWLGETFYVERSFPQAADLFRKGYEKMPSGPKAPDNLLKLGMSLSSMGKPQDACVVYDQIYVKFPNVGSSIRQKVEQEKTQAQCKKKG